MNQAKRNRRNDYYLDVTEFVLTDHRIMVPSPRRSPIQPYLNEVFFQMQLNWWDLPSQHPPSRLALINK